MVASKADNTLRVLALIWLILNGIHKWHVYRISSLSAKAKWEKFIMFQNYLKTSLRFLVKNKGFSFINIIGLSIGTLCCVYILLYVSDQYRYDRYFSHSGDIYRVISQVEGFGPPRIRATTSPPVAPALAAEFPEDLISTRVIPTIGSDQHLLLYQGTEVYEKEAYLVDANFFDLFDFHFCAGSADRALTHPNSIVLLKSVAAKLFGKEDPIGRMIGVLDGYGDNQFLVTGVVDESSGKSSIHAGIFMRANPEGFRFLTDSNWLAHNFIYSFVKLKRGLAASELEKKLPAFLRKHLGAPFGDARMKIELHLQPIASIHTTGGYESEMSKTVSSFFLGILMGIAILIQLIACINFMNLSTARAARRAKEVGVRKIIGADKKGLVFQFLVESILLALAAVLITMLLLLIILPWLNQVTGANIQRTLFADPVVWGLLAGIAILTGILAGSYPAFYLSAFQAPKVIKGDFSSPFSISGLRRSLVVFQFVLSIVLISAICIIRQQLAFIKTRDLGFSKDEQIIFNFYTWSTRKCAEYFALGVREFPEISEVCQADNFPGAFHYESEHVFLPGGNSNAAVALQALGCDEHFLKTMGIELYSGRDFHAHDTGSVIINQTLAKRLGLDSATAPGTTIYSGDGGQYSIAGVMKDFNYESLHDQISPFMVIYKYGMHVFNHVIVRASSSRYSFLLEKMRTIWKQRVFVAPFDYSFLSDEVQKLYETELIMSRIINAFTVMAILISCLGLFGLAAFNAEQRTKEIGIRKIMGASIPAIIRLLSKDFLRLICIAFLLAVPITWLIMSRWLASFVYRIGISWWIFALAGGTALLIAMLTVGFQGFKAAVINPIVSLRAEGL